MSNWSAAELSFQLLLLVMSEPSLARSSRAGSARKSFTPDDCNDGPRARRITFFGAVPVLMKPLIITSLPVPTRDRTEMFSGWAAVAPARNTCLRLPRGREYGGPSGPTWRSTGVLTPRANALAAPVAGSKVRIQPLHRSAKKYFPR